MGKPRKRKKKSSSGSGSDCDKSRGEDRGLTGDNTCKSLSELLNQTNSVLFDESNVNDSVFSVEPSTSSASSQRKNTKMSTSEPSNADILSFLKQISNRLTTMESKLGTLDILKEKVESFECDMKKLWTIVHDNQKEVGERLCVIAERVDSVEFSQDHLHEQIGEMEHQNKALKEEVTYLQAQSMRNNLVFANIPEEEGEDTEKIVKDFIVQKLKVAQECVDNIVLERVHRMGVKRHGYIRSIVAKFNNFKEREMVRRQSKVLKGTHFYVNEQFPKDIADKRRKLVPKMKEARQQGKKAWISYDTLYVDGRPVRT